MRIVNQTDKISIRDVRFAMRMISMNENSEDSHDDCPMHSD